MDRKELEAIVIKAVATIYGKDESELSMDTNICQDGRTDRSDRRRDRCNG